MKYIEIMPVDGRKSFYGKARAYECSDGKKELWSYNTHVATILPTGQIVRRWSGYSVTSMRHINAFLAYYGVQGGGKKWWMNQPVVR